jgi:hypothetical protein
MERGRAQLRAACAGGLRWRRVQAAGGPPLPCRLHPAAPAAPAPPPAGPWAHPGAVGTAQPRTDGGDGIHDLAQLQLVQDGGLTGGIETHLHSGQAQGRAERGGRAGRAAAGAWADRRAAGTPLLTIRIRISFLEKSLQAGDPKARSGAEGAVVSARRCCEALLALCGLIAAQPPGPTHRENSLVNVRPMAAAAPPQAPSG